MILYGKLGVCLNPPKIGWEVRSPEEQIPVCIKTVSPNLPRSNRLFLRSQHHSLPGAVVKQKFQTVLGML